jgi:hypothetical protein
VVPTLCTHVVKDIIIYGGGVHTKVDGCFSSRSMTCRDEVSKGGDVKAEETTSGKRQPERLDRLAVLFFTICEEQLVLEGTGKT